MDEAKKPRGRSKPTCSPTTREIRQCRYCKGKFEVDPAFHWKEFCSESHRKLHWRYGAQSIGKVAARIERDMRKLIAAEMKALRARIEVLERSVTHPPGVGCRIESFDVDEHGKRGGLEVA